MILLIWILSLCPLVCLAKQFSILLIFSKNQLLVLLIPYIVCFVSTWLISVLSLIISCHLLLLDVFVSFYYSAFRCTVKLVVYALTSFFLEALRTMSFSLSTSLIVSHKFGCALLPFSLNSKKSLIFVFIPSLTKVSLRRVLFCFHVNVGFVLFMLFLKMSLSPWWSERMYGIISIFLYLLSPVLLPIIWSVLEKIPWGAEKKVYPFVLRWNVLYIYIC